MNAAKVHTAACTRGCGLNSTMQSMECAKMQRLVPAMLRRWSFQSSTVWPFGTCFETGMVVFDWAVFSAMSVASRARKGLLGDS